MEKEKNKRNETGTVWNGLPLVWLELLIENSEYIFGENYEPKAKQKIENPNNVLART